MREDNRIVLNLPYINGYFNSRPLFTRDRGSGSTRTSDKIKPYVDFSGFDEQVERARRMGTLPTIINFD